jgi:ABC-type Fe3+-hydroxamate transport system substrate-binding protein
MRSNLSTLATLLFLATSSIASAQEPAQVATMNKAEGTVMVDKGKGFVTSKSNAVLNEGDRVITLAKSGAEITFVDGCKAQLKANNMMVIALNPGCKGAIVAVDGAAAAGATTAAAAGPIVPLSAMVVPALVGGAIFAAAPAGNDDTPISGQ